MVFRKNTLKVLLGPEKLLQTGDETNTGTDEQGATANSATRRPREQLAFGKIGDTNVYKRTRPVVQAYETKPKFERYPSGLSLSGQKVEKEDSAKSANKETKVKSAASSKTNLTQADIEKDKTDMDKSDKDKVEDMEKVNDKQKWDTASVAESAQSPPLQKSRRSNNSANTTVSRQFLSDFGLRTDRTDTFSGHHRRRNVASTELERLMEEKAKRHIRNCQVAGNVKRSSKVSFGVKGLREAVSPTQSPLSFYSSPDSSSSRSLLRTKSFFRSDSNLDKHGVVPYMIQVRRNVGSISKTKAIGRSCQGNDPLPEISGRTILVGTACDLG